MSSQQPGNDFRRPGSGIGHRYTYRSLLLWQKAQELALAIVQMVAKLPERGPAQIMARQIMNSASSVGANIAEGHGRYSLPAHKNHLSIAKGSACETDSWLDLLHRAGLLDRDSEEALHSACEEIIRMLTAKILDLERLEQAQSKSSRVREEPAPYLPQDYAQPRGF